MLDNVRDFLRAPRCAVLSTIRADGSPHQIVIHYMPEEEGLLINGNPDRVWCRNIRRDPRVSLVVHDSDDYLHYVNIKGVAEVLREGQAAVDDAMRQAGRYGEDPEEFRHLVRVTYLVRPERVYETLEG
jgi:PPOX class probable F420-dependent enzyme